MNKIFDTLGFSAIEREGVILDDMDFPLSLDKKNEVLKKLNKIFEEMKTEIEIELNLPFEKVKDIFEIFWSRRGLVDYLNNTILNNYFGKFLKDVRLNKLQDGEKDFLLEHKIKEELRNMSFLVQAKFVVKFINTLSDEEKVFLFNQSEIKPKEYFNDKIKNFRLVNNIQETRFKRFLNVSGYSNDLENKIKLVLEEVLDEYRKKFYAEY